MNKQPNVLLVSFDHWPGPLLGCAGHEHILTPTLNQLARSGVLFSRAYSACPTCIPARRTLMTGTTARTHGDRCFKENLEMDPRLPTMPQVFRKAGYQAYAVGKLHVHPQRDRIGFDEVILNEEGRHHLGDGPDDYERFLVKEGYAGRELSHGMGNNEYCARPWHLPEYCHPTNWTTREMCYAIQRRDPRKPGFWYCSYITPHQPITPPRDYWDLYMNLGVDEPVTGGWAENPDDFPYALKIHRDKFSALSPAEVRLARIGFYAQCTYIDHQLRLLIGTLREQGLLDNTVVMVGCDHGDMLGNHNLWCKPPMFEWSARIPLILMPTGADDRVGHHQVDRRLAELRDVMPTLLDLCGLEIPGTVEGISLVSNHCRDHLYCEHYEDERAMRMLRTDRYKLIWYPYGNRFQMFDLENDPWEMTDLAADPDNTAILSELQQRLLSELYGKDLEWIENGRFRGLAEPDFVPAPNRTLLGQRGWR